MVPPPDNATPQEEKKVDTRVVLVSFQPEGCINTIRLLQRIKDEGDEVWLDER